MPFAREELVGRICNRELYDMEADPTERHHLSVRHLDRVATIAA